ncbi:MAG: RAD55 family ATPase [Pyrobaculum sp.]|nr:RAD55 family ATPase [Pyrobaculum sp.]
MGFKTGIQPIDEQIPDGIPAGYVVLIEGFLGVGKTFFASTMAATAANAGAPVLFSIEAMADEVVEEMRRRGASAERLVVVDGFAAPNERYSKLKPPTRHRLETPDAFALMNKLVEFAYEFRGGVVVVDSLNEVVMRSPGSALDLFRAFKIFARSTDSVVVATAHTDVEEVYGVMATAEHLADVILQIEVDPNLEEMGLYVRRMRIARARRLKVAHDWIHFEIVNGRVVEIDVRTMLKMLSKQLRELGIEMRQGR